MSAGKKKLKVNTVAVDVGCGRYCKKPNLSTIFSPKPRSNYKPSPASHRKLHHYNYSSSSTSSSNKTTTTYTDCGTPATFSPTTMDVDPAPPSPALCCSSEECPKSTVRGLGRVGGESLAVEKESDDPYLDFRHSMLQMILEKQIYSKDDLRELLHCFLQLNSPYHHGIIVRAFTEIWDGVFSVRYSAGSPLLRCTRRSRDF
ncbi:transcription repressor OFP6 [Carica papaya]|uniref:transcription repressor OFP6 n=1 Tax=Carica papaya TaxID=3649 RepID=UPI000B8CB39B|nr:transcription repressor OFP6 [Carica papaya]